MVGLTTVAFMFEIELQPDSGGVDYVLSKLGIVSDSHAWTIGYGSALFIISVIVVWFASGLTMLILTGGMQSIPRELYEAADVDGGSWWDKERRITLPMLRRSIALSLIISVIGSFLAFNQFFVLAQNNVGLETVVEWIYQTAFTQYQIGYATAMAICLVLVIALRHDRAVLRPARHHRAMSDVALSTAAVKAPRPRRRKRGPGFWVYLAVGLMLAFVFVLPLVWSVLRSFQPADLASRQAAERPWTSRTSRWATTRLSSASTTSVSTCSTA